MGTEAHQSYDPIEGAHDASVDGSAHLAALRAERAGWEELAQTSTPVANAPKAEATGLDSRDEWKQDDEDVWGARSGSHLPGVTLSHEDNDSDW